MSLNATSLSCSQCCRCMYTCLAQHTPYHCRCLTEDHIPLATEVTTLLPASHIQSGSAWVQGELLSYIFCFLSLCVHVIDSDMMVCLAPRLSCTRVTASQPCRSLHVALTLLFCCIGLLKVSLTCYFDRCMLVYYFTF